MKKIYHIILLSAVSVILMQKGLAQTAADSIQNNQISKGMFLFIKNNLQMTDEEARKAEPIINQYIIDMRRTQLDYKDAMERQQQKATVRLNYRNQLSPVLGQARANRVFIEEARFRNEVRKLIQQRKNQQKKRRKSI